MPDDQTLRDASKHFRSAVLVRNEKIARVEVERSVIGWYRRPCDGHWKDARAIAHGRAWRSLCRCRDAAKQATDKPTDDARNLGQWTTHVPVDDDATHWPVL